MKTKKYVYHSANIKIYKLPPNFYSLINKFLRLKQYYPIKNMGCVFFK